MIKDYHMHPRIVTSPERFELFARKAIDAGIEEVCITDHMPVSVSNSPDRIPEGRVSEYCSSVRRLAEEYARGEFEVLSLDDYCNLVADALMLLPEHVVVHRLTGDGAKRDLIAPMWSADKKRVLNTLQRTLRERSIVRAE